MSTHRTLDACIATPTGWVQGRLHADAQILAIEGDAVAQPPATALRVLPGFVDLHIHGGAGHDIMSGEAATRAVARACVRHGTTAWLPTTMTDAPQALSHAVQGVAAAMRQPDPGSARILGLHLEGPYIAADRLGAQPPDTRPFDLDEFDRLAAQVPVKVVTLAPEVPGHLELIPVLAARGIRVQLGHSSADYDTTRRALEAGAQGFTHLFNAMSPLHHRAPGMVGAALAHAHSAELIADLLHVHPGALRAALRAIPDVYCVSDATAATGMPDGAYLLGRLSVQHCAGAVRLPDGQLAGSALTLDQAWRNLLAIGLHPLDAVRRLSTLPADAVGESRLGRLAVGAHADFVVMDAQWQVQSVWIGGQPVRHSQA